MNLLLNPKVLIIFLISLAIVLYLSMFTVKETELAVQFRLGEIIKTDFSKGLHFQTPIYNNVKKFEARVLTVDLSVEEFLSADKKRLEVDSFVKWRIVDVSEYYRATVGVEQQAMNRLSTIINNALKSEISQRTMIEVVSKERRKVMDEVHKNVNLESQKLGIEIVDVRIKRIEFPEGVTSSIYNRMIAERQSEANKYRSEGKEEAKIIQGDAERQREVILSQAYKEAETIRGEADAISTEVYADAYGKDPEFYRFYRSLNAYKTVFSTGQDMLVVKPDSEFFKYFNYGAKK